jgi:formylglycine-generating enzyme required for sulfatase activity
MAVGSKVACSVIAASLITLGVSGDATSAVAGASLKCDGADRAGEAASLCVVIGDSFKDCTTCPELTVVPPGEVVMGSPESEVDRGEDEGPQHVVKVEHPLAIGKFEVTFAEWDACVDDGGCTHKARDAGWGRGRRPAINVSWDDITNEYLPWLSRKTGHTYRLLSESEWEYAARAGTTTAFATGSTITTDQANFDGTNTYAGSPKGIYRQRTLEVGSFPQNRFGLHDMHGNVWEWVNDCYAGPYSTAKTSPTPPSEKDGCSRILRGGSWIDSPRVLRSAYRGKMKSNARFIYRGFRVLRDH